MKKALVFMFVLLFATTAFAQNPLWFTGDTYDGAKELAADEGKLILVFFHRDG